ncbi:alpha/beta hydrolase [Nesterenkonia salmonea]|uniref:alpha/beta hydrolase n=1 Tax=Nesterenkonia salmonea TaxID=1804987 RepID=UPI001409048E|nr:alpha/beta hydrolase [Nesterenkonia salmonea]
MEINGQWHTLAAAAASLATETSSAAAEMESAADSWAGLVSSYQESQTQDIVRTALDEVPGVTREWAEVAGRASQVLQRFATEANGLQQQASALQGQASTLQARLLTSGLLSGSGEQGTSVEDEALRRDIEVHNSDVMGLNSRWHALEQQTAAEIDSIAGGGGYQDQIPVVGAAGTGFGSAAFSLTDGSPGNGRFGSNGLFGVGSLGFAFHSAVTQMIRSGDDSGAGDPVETATELYETVTSNDVTGEDIRAFYDHLGQMDAEGIDEFAEANPQINQYSMPLPTNEDQLESWPTGADGASWWNGMESREQNAMVAFLPLLTGNTQGVPAQKRHEANMNALDILRQSGQYNEYEQHLNSIQDSTTSQGAGTGQRFLLSLDVGTEGDRDRQPLAEVAVGNPDQASEVTYNVPGMNSSTANMTGEVDRAQDIFDETNDQAVIAWMAYDPPTLDETIPESLEEFWDEDEGLTVSWEELRHFEGAPHEELFDQNGSVMNDVRADEGSYRFAYALDGQQSASAARGNDDMGINVVAHSYGTNMVSHALTLDNQQSTVDKVLFAGSSGIPASAASSAEELNVERTEEGKPAVFVTEAEADWLAALGRGGEVNAFWRDEPYVVVPEDMFASPRVDPRSEEFDAYVYSSDVEEPFWFWEEASEEQSVTDHTRYDADPDIYGYQDPATLSFESKIEILNGDMGSVEFERSPGSEVE